MSQSRKDFLKNMGLLSAGAVAVPGFIQSCSAAKSSDDLFFDISLAEWSLNGPLFGGELTNLEFPEMAKSELGIDAVEYVNQFFKDKAEDKKYLNELNQRCEDLGVSQQLIMIDGEGALAASNKDERKNVVENHYKWVDAANHLGCHSIRVNARGNGTPEEQKKAAVDGLRMLATFAKDANINIIVENHGGYSSNGDWLTDVMQQVDMENCGTLPDFGNFCIKHENGSCVDEYDRYKGVRQLMPYAKGVSAKSYDFNKDGKETTIDFTRMLKIVKEAGFTGHIGIEYEGSNMSPKEGIMATKELLTTVGQQLSK